MDNMGYDLIKFKNIVTTDKGTIELVRNWRNSDNVKRYMLTNHHISKQEHKEWLKSLKSIKDKKVWVIYLNEKPIGVATLFKIDYKNKTTDWGFYIADKFLRGKNIGSFVLVKLMEYVFDKMKFHKMYTTVLENNPGALKLYKKFGFKEEGRLKEHLLRDEKYIDIILVGILAEEWQKVKEFKKYFIINKNVHKMKFKDRNLIESKTKEF